MNCLRAYTHIHTYVRMHILMFCVYLCVMFYVCKCTVCCIIYLHMYSMYAVIYSICLWCYMYVHTYLCTCIHCVGYDGVCEVRIGCRHPTRWTEQLPCTFSLPLSRKGQNLICKLQWALVYPMTSVPQKCVGLTRCCVYQVELCTV